MRIGVVGFGYVGRAICKYFGDRHSISIYDKYCPEYCSDHSKKEVNACDLKFIAVPTLTSADGWSCDLTAINDVFNWITGPVCIKSTIPPGTTERLGEQCDFQVGFSPEYIGESAGHEWTEIGDCGFVIVGGAPALTSLVQLAYRMVNPALVIRLTSPRAAELAKYMENAFLATKISFVNQFYDIASHLDVTFDELIALWQLDQRMGRSHCRVTPERGYGGKCLPKDIKAIIAAVNEKVSTQFLKDVVSYNNEIRLRETAKT